MHTITKSLPYIVITFLTISLFLPTVTHAQLKPDEKEGIIYSQQRMGAKRGGFRYNGEKLNGQQVKNLLLSNPDSRPQMKKALGHRRIGLIVGGLSVGSVVFALAQPIGPPGRRNPVANRRSNSFLIIGTTGLLSAEVTLLLGSRNANNALRLFNKQTKATSLTEQAGETDTTAKLLNRSSFLQGKYYYRGETIGHRGLDKLLGESPRAKPFYQLVQRNKKVARISGVASGIMLGFMIVSNSQRNLDSENPSTGATTRFFLSAGGMAVGLTTWAIATLYVRQHRYNASRLFNDESPVPFDRRTRRIIHQITLGTTPNGVGLLVHF